MFKEITEDEYSEPDFDFIYKSSDIDKNVSWKLLDTFIETPICCSNTVMRYENGMSTCINCGLVDMNDREVLFPFQQQYELTVKQCYMRKSYFKEKLRLLACINFSKSPLYQPLLRKLNKISTINKIKNAIEGKGRKYIIQLFIDVNLVNMLRDMLKRLNYSKLYKHIYNIIFDVFGVKVFDINEQLIDKLTYDWIKFETNFRRLMPMKHNMVNYNVILYNLFRRHKIANYKMLVLPLNKKNIQKIVQTNLLIEINFIK
jgi:hypothetical protein